MIEYSQLEAHLSFSSSLAAGLSGYQTLTVFLPAEIHNQSVSKSPGYAKSADSLEPAILNRR